MFHRCLVGLVPAIVITTSVSADVVDANLVQRMEAVGPEGTVSALVYLNEQVDIQNLSTAISEQRLGRTIRHQMVVETLQDVAAANQGPVLNAIDALRIKGLVDEAKPYWIANLIHVTGRPGAIKALSLRDDVGHIYLDYGIELVEPVGKGPIVPADNTTRGANPTPGLTAIRADVAWGLGFDGDGVLVAILDTGVDGSHAALSSRWAGNHPSYNGHPEWAYHDPYGGNHGNPVDSSYHGTHVMGTVCGGLPGEVIGVAPGAMWMASRGIDEGGIEQTVANAIDAFQWMADPDGIAFTSWDVPNVCSNSWGLVTAHGYPDCDETFWSYIDALEAAGCLVLFSAGNEGSSSNSLRRPADRAISDYSSMAIGAVDPHSSGYPIAGFSSRGPTYCTDSGTAAIKPDVSAPGVDTYSASPGGGYTNLSGTSMASPHVNGAIALMFQANPDLEIEVAKQIVYDTSIDLGIAGKDNDYGYGMIDCVNMIEAALETVTLSWDFPDGRPTWLEPSGGEEISVTITGNELMPEPSTATLHIVAGGGTLELPLVHNGGPNYRAVFPELNCGATVSYYFSVESTEGDLSTSPYGAPGDTWSGDAWSGYEQSFLDDFESDLGWTTTSGALTGNWIRATPTEGGDRCDPGSDSDGSGQCFVTGNSGDEDVDDGETTLTSPNMDGSADEAIIEYDFWYNNGANCGGADFANDVFVVDISTNGGLNWYPLDTVGPAGPEVNGGWITRSFPMSDLPVDPSDQMRLRFTCGDLGEGSIIEAGVDNVRIGYHFCNESDPCPGDFDENGFIGVNDVLYMISAWGTPNGDINNDGATDVNDLLLLLSVFGNEC